MRRILTLFSLALITGVTSADVSAYKDALKQAHTSDAAKDFISARKSLGIALAAAKTPEEKAHVLMAVGQVYSDEGNNPKAREVWQQVLDSEGGTRDQKWGALTGIGTSYLKEKNYPQARATLSQIIADPTAPADLAEAMYLMIAQSLSEQGKMDAARAEFAKIYANPKVTADTRWIAQNSIAQMSYDAHNWAQARADYLKASQLPADVLYVAQSRNRIEETYWKEDDTAHAKTVNNGFKAAVLREAEAAEKARKFDDMREAYEALLLVSGEHEDPDRAAAYRNNIARSYIGEKNYDQARKETQNLLDFITGFKAPDKQKQLTSANVRGLKLIEDVAHLTLADLSLIQGDKAGAAQGYQKLLLIPDLDPQLRARAETNLAKAKA